MKIKIALFISIICVLVADLTTKHFLFNVNYFNLIPNVISLASNGGNAGAAWGIFAGKTLFLIVVSVIMVIALFVLTHYIKNKNIFFSIGAGFVVGGAIGNLIDRCVFGYVRDFIFLDFFPTFPIFNLADSFLCVGAVMMSIHILFMSGKKSEK